MRAWPKIRINTPNGVKEAIAPSVISASRATDIPAFYTEWFMSRLDKGYCEWRNPFNPGQIQYVSFSGCKAIVFWSKNPEKILPHLSKLDEKGIRYYFQFTLNDYEQEQLEPGVPPLRDRLATFQRLSLQCPVIWRYDPVIKGANLNVKEHLRRIRALMPELCQHTDRLVFSFVDMHYRKARNNLRKLDGEFGAPDDKWMNNFIESLAELNAGTNKPLKLAVCGEEYERLCFARYGIEKNHCIDPDLISRIIFHSDHILPEIPAQGSLLASQTDVRDCAYIDASKDTGQRKLCGCAPSKDIGSYQDHYCGHKCRYCYAHN